MTWSRKINMFRLLVMSALLLMGLQTKAIEVPDWPLEVEARPGDRLILLHVSKEDKMFRSAYDNVSLTQTGTDWDYPFVGYEFNPRQEYNGYFNPYMCYRYNRDENIFVIDSLVKVSQSTQKSVSDSVQSRAGDGSQGNQLIGHYYCNPIDKNPGYYPDRLWSGNYLNYLTMSRMDLVRYQLYGGKRILEATIPSIITEDVDPKEPLALERAHIPPDLDHSWVVAYSKNNARFTVGDPGASSADLSDDSDGNAKGACYPVDPTKEKGVKLDAGNSHLPTASDDLAYYKNFHDGTYYNSALPADALINKVPEAQLDACDDKIEVPVLSADEAAGLFTNTGYWHLSTLTPFGDPDTRGYIAEDDDKEESKASRHVFFANATVRHFLNSDTPFTAESPTDFGTDVDAPDKRMPTLRALYGVKSPDAWRWTPDANNSGSEMFDNNCYIASGKADTESLSSSGEHTKCVTDAEQGDFRDAAGLYDFRVRVEVDCEREKGLLVKAIEDLEEIISNEVFKVYQGAEKKFLSAKDKLAYDERQVDSLCGAAIGNAKTDLDALKTVKTELLTRLKNYLSDIDQNNPTSEILEHSQKIRENLNRHRQGFESERIGLPDFRAEELMVQYEDKRKALGEAQDAYNTALRAVGNLPTAAQLSELTKKRGILVDALADLQAYMKQQGQSLATAAQKAAATTSGQEATKADDLLKKLNDYLNDPLLAPQLLEGTSLPSKLNSSNTDAWFADKKVTSFDKGSYNECNYQAGETTSAEITQEGEVKGGSVADGSCSSNINNRPVNVTRADLPTTGDISTDPGDWLSQLERINELIEQQNDAIRALKAACDDAEKDASQSIAVIKDSEKGLTNSKSTLDLANERYAETAKRHIKFTRACEGGKPIGLLTSAKGAGFKWGLMTTSYSNPTDGGVLRVPLGKGYSRTNYVNNRIINTLDKLRVASHAGASGNFDYRTDIDYTKNCKPTTGMAPLRDWSEINYCPNVGDPVAEYLLEGLRQFAGEVNFRKISEDEDDPDHNDPGFSTRMLPTDGFFSSTTDGNIIDDKVGEFVTVTAATSTVRGSKETYVDFMGNKVEIPVAEYVFTDNNGNTSTQWPFDPFQEYGACSEGLQLTYTVAGSSFDGKSSIPTEHPDVFTMLSSIDYKHKPDPMGTNRETSWSKMVTDNFGGAISSKYTSVNGVDSGFLTGNPLIGATSDNGTPSVSFKAVAGNMNGQYRKGISSGGSYYVIDITPNFDEPGNGEDIHTVYEDEEDGYHNIESNSQEAKNCKKNENEEGSGARCSATLLDDTINNQGIRLMSVEAQHTLPRIRFPQQPLNDGSGNPINLSAAADNSSEARKNKFLKEQMNNVNYIEFVPVAHIDGNTQNPSRIAALDMVTNVNTTYGFTYDDNIDGGLIIDDDFYGKYTKNGINNFFNYNLTDASKDDPDPLVPRFVYSDIDVIAPGNVNKNPASKDYHNGFPYMKFNVTFEPHAVGNDTSKVVVQYTLSVLDPGGKTLADDTDLTDNTLSVKTKILYSSTPLTVNAGYILSGVGGQNDLELPVSTTGSSEVASSQYRFAEDDTSPFLHSPLWYAVDAGYPDRRNNYYVLHNIVHEGLPYMLDNLEVNTVVVANPYDCESTRDFRQSSSMPTGASTDANAFIYSSWFDVCGWAGDLKVYRLNEEGYIRSVNPQDDNPYQPYWSAAAELTKDYYGAGNTSRKVEYLKNSVEGDSRFDTPAPFSEGGVSRATFMWKQLLTDPIKLASNPSSTAELAYVNKIINWSRGGSAYEVEQTGGIFRARKVIIDYDGDKPVYSTARTVTDDEVIEGNTNILGDIINSTVVFVGSPGNLLDMVKIDPSYKDWAIENNAIRNRAKMVYVGANDGMVHAFNALTGKEKYALMLNTTADKLNEIASPGYDCNYQLTKNFNLFSYSDRNCHKFLVNGPQVAGDAYWGGSEWRSLLIGTTGSGGKGVYAIDITDPDNIHALWEIRGGVPDTPYENLYYTYGKPTIAHLENKQAVILLANGYDDQEGYTNTEEANVQGAASLFVIDAKTGALIKEISAVPPSGSTRLNDVSRTIGGLSNGLSTPLVLDYTRDGLVDFVYAGDLYGNIYRFDLRNPSYFGDAGELDTTRTSVLAQLSSGTQVVQSITSMPAAVKYSYVPKGSMTKKTGLMLMFGTGKYVERSDDLTGVKNAFYAIFDDPEKSISDPIAKYNDNDGSIDGLVQRKLSDIVCSISSNANLSKDSSTCSGDDSLMVTSSSIPIFVYQDYDDLKSAANWQDIGKSGWYIQLYDNGERVINRPSIIGDNVVFYSIKPAPGICMSGGVTHAYTIKWRTGLPDFNISFLTSTTGNVNESGNMVKDAGAAVRKTVSTDAIMTNYSTINSGFTTLFYGSSAGDKVKDIVTLKDMEIGNLVKNGCTYDDFSEQCLEDIGGHGGANLIVSGCQGGNACPSSRNKNHTYFNASDILIRDDNK